MIVENKPGAAGNIGTEAVARANPDGHVIGIGNFAPLAVATDTRRPQLPEVPTFAELGLKGAAFIAAESTRWTKIIKDKKITGE